jgi:DNA-binding Lrp family transcriptional regulator
MDSLHRHFINEYQGGFPIVAQPYSSVAAMLGTDENTLISMVRDMLDDRSLSRFGPMYDAVCLGGGLTLAAMIVPETQFDAVAEQVNTLHEVAHNYRRDHELNMWFVIATDTPEGIGKAIATIEERTGLAVYNFPKLQEFYIGLWLRLDDEGGVSTQPVDYGEQNSEHVMDELDRQIIRATQGGLPLSSHPYADVAAQLDSDEVTVMNRVECMLHSGIIRRIGAVPNHYKLGLRGNGMSVWDVPDDQLDVLGEQIGQLEFVSHCYERPRHLPLWPYNLFAMVHGHDRDEVNDKVALIDEMLGDACRQHEVLFSSAILKKTGLRLAA